MNENSPTPKCPRCGATATADAPDGLCPRCLIALSLATQTDVTGDDLGARGTEVAKPPPPPAPSLEEVARLFPHLEILELLGQGGMGAVYKARQPKLDRLVALKVLLRRRADGTTDPAFGERFAREARALARLNHPAIVAVYEYGEAGGYPFLLMEHVEGLTLRPLLQRGKLAAEEALAIVPKICEALQFAHQRGVVHRDIKPENILLDKDGQVKIADFGIAKILAPGAQDLSLTGGRDVVGTPHYMAPEQVEHPQQVDHRADIYSLGVVFYEMLTGELPLGKFLPPSKKVQVDVRLDEVVLHALEKEPERRYQHASEVKTDVETIASRPRPDGAAAATTVGAATSIPAAPRGRHPDPAGPLPPPAWAISVRRAARILTVLTLSLVAWQYAVVLSHGDRPLPTEELTPANALDLTAWFLMMLGLLVGWKHEGVGAALLGTGWTLWHISWGRLFPLWNAVHLPLVVAVLHAAYWWATTGHQTVRLLNATGVCLLVLVAGLLAAPYTVPGRGERDPEIVVRVEEELRHAIEQRLADGGWRLEGLNINVSPDLKRAECRWNKIWKNGLTQEPPLHAAIHLESQRDGLWLVRGQYEFRWLRFSVNTANPQAEPEWKVAAQSRVAVEGGTFELVAVAEHPATNWWRPDGTSLEAVWFANLSLRGNPRAGEKCREFVFRAEGFPQDVPLCLFPAKPSLHPKPADRWTHVEPYFTRVDYPPGRYYLVAMTMPQAERVMDLHVLLGTDWKTIGEGKPGQTVPASGPALGGRLVFGSLVEQTNQTVEMQAICSQEQDLRMLAIDDQGLLIEPTWYGSSEDINGTLVEAVFPAIPSRRIKAFRVQAAQYAPIRFANVCVEPNAATAAAFGPVAEVTLNDMDDYRGGEALDLDSGTLLDLPKDIEKRTENQQFQWLKDHSADVFLDNVHGRWGLITPAANELKLALLPREKWETATERDLSQALAAEPSGLEIKQQGSWTVYILPTNAPPPLTFVFRTATGALGLLQITRFGEHPNCARLRYKLTQRPPHEASQSPELILRAYANEVWTQLPPALESVEIKDAEAKAAEMASDIARRLVLPHQDVIRCPRWPTWTRNSRRSSPGPETS